MGIILFLIGIFIGAIFGVGCMSLMFISSESDKVEFFNDVKKDDI